MLSEDGEQAGNVLASSMDVIYSVGACPRRSPFKMKKALSGASFCAESEKISMLRIA